MAQRILFFVNRNPVRRQGAERYVLITLLSFASSVTLTRLFLELTGYPKIGNGEYHIAHVLWGGMLLFIAAILPLFLANRWVYTVGAILTGTGVGLFIDEVGKFITQNNDYFHPLAAPIIYAFFLLTVLLYVRMRRPPDRTPKVELFRSLDAFEEILENDLDPDERSDLEERLRYVAAQTDRPDLVHLANTLLEFLAAEVIEMVEIRQTIFGKINRWWTKMETRWLNRLSVRIFLALGLAALGLPGVMNFSYVAPTMGRGLILERTVLRHIEEGELRSASGLNWFSANIALDISIGLVLILAGFLLLINKENLGVAFGYLGLLLALTTGNLLVFYFEQFSTIVLAFFQFCLLLGLLYYRRRFMSET